VTREEIIAEAREWIGDPKAGRAHTVWIHQASCKNVGADCIGYIAGVAANCGSAEGKHFLAGPRDYGRHPDPDFMFATCEQLMDRIAITSATIADVMIFNCGKHPMHFAFPAPNGRMLHAWLMARRVCEHTFDETWRRQIVRAYRIRGIT
jgi:cell wall-associated NlpC family hydrolase